MWASQLSGWKATGKLCLEKQAAHADHSTPLTVIIVVILIVVMIKHADHHHHYFGHLALVDQEKQVVQGNPTQRSELAIRTCDLKNNT